MLNESELLIELKTRLPELEWNISSLGSSFSPSRLPKGLFRNSSELNGDKCVAEIKADIQALSQQENQRSAFYLAERIRQKINVLVVLCQIHKRKNITKENAYFGVKMLSTRQQWIQTLEDDIQVLEQQREALTKTLDNMIRNHHADALLQVKAELGEIERRLTLARETLQRAVS